MASTVWRGYLSFGLISIPVRLFRAARAERVSLRRLYRTEIPASQPPARGRYREPSEPAQSETAQIEPELAGCAAPGKKGILGHTMFYESEVRADEEYRADTSSVSGKELKLAETLIHSLAGPFEPARYRDTYRERLEAMLAKKMQGRPLQAPQQVQKPADVVDIAEALRKSLANLKKPAVSERRKPAKRDASGQ